MDTTLVIMAAGIGSRFGSGIKQLETVDNDNHIIIDYSIHDAIEAGINKIVFVIRKDIESEFKTVIGNRIEAVCASHNVVVEYAFQKLDDIPGTLPEGRVKPWGTGQAVLAAKTLLTTPFIIINADDYYGKEGIRAVQEYLVQEGSTCMAGYVLKNTLSDHGGVTRGVCKIDAQSNLTEVSETKNIIKIVNGAEANGKFLNSNSLVSMNMWGFTPEILDYLDQDFAAFLSAQKEGDLKCEYLIPTVVDDMLKKQLADVQVLETRDRWFGVTYAEDKAYVTDSIQALVKGGIYPEKLFQ